SEEAAKTHLGHLQKKGLRGARLHARGSATGQQLFQLRGLESSEQAAFEQLRAEFPAQQVRPCGPAEGLTGG
ncbi:MAG TPA: SPOR domain-containing protein, partial [Burkholderiaceae bacterium]|nr:SPOR domain-containing protein [Burkholderiaceae bacterium]